MNKFTILVGIVMLFNNLLLYCTSFQVYNNTPDIISVRVPGGPPKYSGQGKSYINAGELTTKITELRKRPKSGEYSNWEAYSHANTLNVVEFYHTTETYKNIKKPIRIIGYKAGTSELEVLAPIEYEQWEKEYGKKKEENKLESEKEQQQIPVLVQQSSLSEPEELAGTACTIS